MAEPRFSEPDWTPSDSARTEQSRAVPGRTQGVKGEDQAHFGGTRTDVEKMLIERQERSERDPDSAQGRQVYFRMKVVSIGKAYSVGEVMIQLEDTITPNARRRITLNLPESEAGRFHYGDTFTIGFSSQLDRYTGEER
jgi:hypothetical protein